MLRGRRGCQGILWYPTFRHSVDVMNVPFKPPWVTEIDSPAVFGVDGRGVQVPVQTQRRGGRKQVVFVVVVPLIVPVVVIVLVFVPVLALVRVLILVLVAHRLLIILCLRSRLRICLRS